MPSAAAPTTVVGPLESRLVDVTGSDRASYLEATTTQRFDDLRPGRVRGALVLDAHGSPLAVADVGALEDRYVALVPAGCLDAVVEVLGGRTFLADVRFEPTAADVVAVRGPDAGDRVADVVARVGPGEVAASGDLVVVGRVDGVDLAGPPAAVRAVVAALGDAGVAVVGADVLEARRIVAGEPAWGSEIVAGRLPEELGLLATHVHLAKGCYPGQEAVARMWMLGRPRRRLARVRTSDGVSAGWSAGTGRGRTEVTSVAPDQRVALAYVPADAAAGMRAVGDDGTWVEVVELVGDGVEVPGADPAVTRRRDRRPERRGA